MAQTKVASTQIKLASRRKGAMELQHLKANLDQTNLVTKPWVGRLCFQRLNMSTTTYQEPQFWKSRIVECGSCLVSLFYYSVHNMYLCSLDPTNFSDVYNRDFEKQVKWMLLFCLVLRR